MSSLTTPPTSSGFSQKEPTALPVYLENWYAQKKQEERLLVPQTRADAAPSRIIPPAEDKEEKKAPVKVRLRLMARPSKGKRGAATKPVVQKLSLSNASTSAAATPLTLSVPLLPASSGDWSSLSALFDEVRVLSSTIHWKLNTSAVSATPVSGVCAYDPIESTSLASLANALVYPKHALFAMPAGPTAQSFAPLTHTPMGYWSLGAKVYPDSVRNTTSTAITNGWMSTSDASDIWGYWKFLIEAASASVTVTLSYHIVFTCEFRSRQ